MRHLRLSSAIAALAHMRADVNRVIPALPVRAARAHSQMMSRPLRCLVGWHSWKRMTTDDNEVYLACSRCGKLGEGNPLPGAGAAG